MVLPTTYRPSDVARVPFEAPMPRSRRVRLLASTGALAVAIALLLHGCGPEPTEPAMRAGLTYRLTIGAGSSTAGGTIASSHGGISCTVVGATGASAGSGGGRGRDPARPRG